MQRPSRSEHTWGREPRKHVEEDCRQCSEKNAVFGLRVQFSKPMVRHLTVDESDAFG